MKTRILALTASAALLLASAFAQESTPAGAPAGDAATQQTQSAPSTEAPAPAAASETAPAPHQPLQLEQHEGFWGKLNPFARKKYVRRQLQPVVGRVNELDDLTAANAKNIRDVDARAQQGIHLASLRADQADQHAMAAGQQAEQANQTAQQASTRLTSVQQAVGNLDQYKPVTEVEIHFRPGQTILTKQAKDALDQLAEQMANQHGTIVQVQGFSSGPRQAAIAHSQAMADSVVRYLVLEHDVPLWRIYTVGMGNAPVEVDGQPRRIHGARVEIALLKNSAADLQASQAGAAAGSDNAQPASSPVPGGMEAPPAPAPAQAPAPAPTPDNPK